MDGVCIPDYLDPDSDGDGKPSDYGLLFHFLDAVVVGVTHDPPTRYRRRRAAPLSQADFDGSTFCFCFQSRGPDPLRGGGRAPTDPEIKKTRPRPLAFYINIINICYFIIHDAHTSHRDRNLSITRG